MRGMLLAAVLLAASVSSVFAADYKLLVLGGHPLKWGESRFGTGAAVTYSFIQAPQSFPDAINCKGMTPVAPILDGSGISPERFRDEVRLAFDDWERVADLRFRYTADVAAANILIGAQARPRGIAFANVWFGRATAGDDVAPLTRASICLNPDRIWEDGLDSDQETLSLRQILTHEIGHAIGLDHPGPAGALMGYRYSEAVPGLQSGDATGATTLYGVSRGSVARRR